MCRPGKEAQLRVLGHVLVELPHGERHQIRHDVRPFVLRPFVQERPFKI